MTLPGCSLFTSQSSRVPAGKRAVLLEKAETYIVQLGVFNVDCRNSHMYFWACFNDTFSIAAYEQ